MSTKLKIAAAVAAAVLLSACSSPKHEPMPLVKFTPSWKSPRFGPKDFPLPKAS